MPIMPVAGPFFRDILCGQIKELQQAVIGREDSAAFGDFPKLTIEPLNGIGSIDYFPHFFRIFKVS